MAEHGLTPTPSLPDGSTGDSQFDGLTIALNDTTHMASLACRKGQEKAFAAAAKELFGSALPGPSGLVEGKEFSLFWTGPDQWFVETRLDKYEDIAAILKATFADTASITEQSGAWACFELSGSGALKLLERLCMVDIEKMPTGSAVRTVMEHLGVFVICREAGSRYTILGARSSTSSLQHALVTAAASAL
ncbi:MAG: sarcosine oxidase subunit gamma family protein [Rhizobiaceae bacterium]|nr:sarcosine oxidase subunit gamma family protein [Rhizobiaceae bacterium]